MKFLDKLKTFCGWVYKANLKYEEYERLFLIIVGFIFVIFPKDIITALFLLFFIFRYFHITGNWWYEWGDIEEDHEERNYQTGE